MRQSGLMDLGIGRVLRAMRSGQLVVDVDTIRRPEREGPDVGCDIEVGAYDAFAPGVGYDAFDPGNIGADLEELFEEEEVGAAAPARRPVAKLPSGLAMLRAVAGPRAAQQAALGQQVSQIKAATTQWGTAFVDGSSATVTSAQNVEVRIRLQHNFRAEDLLFDGTTAGSLITGIKFGDRQIWSSSTGLALTIFQATNMIRNLLRGQFGRIGTDIVITGYCAVLGTPPTGVIKAVLIGTKPVAADC